MANEEMIIAVSDTHISEGDTIIVKEAQPPEPQPIGSLPPLPFPEDEERKTRDKPKSWLDSQSAEDFVPFLETELKRIKPSSACINSHNEAERAFGQYRRLNGHISKALQSDYDSKLPIDLIDRHRQYVEREQMALDRMLEAHKEMKKRRRNVRRASDELCSTCSAPLWEDGEDMVCLSCDQGIKKEAGTPHIVVQINAFENAITGMLINAKVSGGRNIEEIYDELKKKYGFTNREELSILQILADKGFPVFKDRARLGENEDPTDPDKPREWMTNYFA